MSWKFLLVLLLNSILLINCQKRGRWKVQVKEDDSAKKTAALLAKYACTPKYCGKRGQCYLDMLNRAKCECYWQYYSGPHCERLATACFPSEMKKELPTCAEGSECFSTYGLNNCRCEADFIGRTCDIYLMGVDSDKGFGQIVAMDLQPSAGVISDIYVGVIHHGDAVKYSLLMEGISYDIEMDAFHRIDSETILSNITHLTKNESMCK